MDILISHWHCIIPAIAMLLAMFFLRGKDSDTNKKKKTKIPMKNSW